MTLGDQLSPEQVGLTKADDFPLLLGRKNFLMLGWLFFAFDLNELCELCEVFEFDFEFSPLPPEGYF